MVTSSGNEKPTLAQSRSTDFSTINGEEIRTLTTSGIHHKKNTHSSSSYCTKDTLRKRLTARVSPMKRNGGEDFEKKLTDDSRCFSKQRQNHVSSSISETATTTINGITNTNIKVKQEYADAPPCQETLQFNSSTNGKHKSLYTSHDHPPTKCRKVISNGSPFSSNISTLPSHPPLLQPMLLAEPKPFVENMPMISLLTASQGHLATLQDDDGDTPLHIAIAQGQAPLVNYLTQMTLASGISLDIYNKLKQTPLHLAVITNQPSIVRILVSAGVDANIPDRNGQTAVHLACQRSSVECLMELVNCRNPINFVVKNYNGLTPLHEAVMSNSPEIISFLVACGADVDSKDGKSGRTPLHYAVEQDLLPLIQLLIQLGANVSASSYAGSTPIQTASGRGMHHITKLLLGSINESSSRNTSSTTTLSKNKESSRK